MWQWRPTCFSCASSPSTASEVLWTFVSSLCPKHELNCLHSSLCVFFLLSLFELLRSVPRMKGNAWEGSLLFDGSIIFHLLANKVMMIVLWKFLQAENYFSAPMLGTNLTFLYILFWFFVPVCTSICREYLSTCLTNKNSIIHPFTSAHSFLSQTLPADD